MFSCTEETVIGYLDSKQEVITNALQPPKKLDTTMPKTLNSFATCLYTGSAFDFK